MANNNQKVNVQINLDGKKAEDLIQSMTSAADRLKKELQDVKDSDMGFDEKAREVSRLEKELKPLQVLLGNTQKAYIDVQRVMDDLSGNTLRNLQNALRRVKQDMLGASEDNRKMEELRKQYAAIDGQIQKLKRDYVDVNDVVNNLDIATENMMRKAISQLRELRADTLRGTDEWSTYDNQIKQIERTLDGLSGKRTVNPQDVLGNLSGSSSAEIKEAISLMENLREQTVLGSDEWKNYGADIEKARGYLEQFTKEQRMSVDLARQISESPGNYSVSQAREAIAVLKEYRDTLSVSDTTGLQQVDAQIQAINQSLTLTRERLIDTSNILENPANFSPEQIKQAIAEVNKELDSMAMNDPRRDGLKNQVENLNQTLKETKSETVDVQDVLNRLPNASMKELQQAARQLKEEMDALDTTTESYTKKKAEYIEIQNRIAGINKEFKNQENAVSSVMKRLAAYVGIYGVFNLLRTNVRDLVKDNLELSDSLADIQKTTGMTAKEVSLLSQAIDGIDTRTAQQELHDLAFQAGKLGISGVQDVFEFVRAGNQLVVALGEDLGGAEAVKNLMKINEVLGTTAELGIERALLATGSAINEVGQSSTANEGYMVDFAQRLGGIAAQSNLTMAELIALGGTTDALGQNVEVSATAMNKFIVTLQTNVRAVAQAAGVTESALQELLDSGKTMDAMLLVFEGLSKKGGISNLAPLMKDLGSEGARLTAVLTSLVGNTELMKAQLYTANKAFEDATSITNEYNVKNENAAAILERMGNSIKEYFVNSQFVGWLKEVLVAISNLPKWLDRNYTAIRLVASAIAAVTLQLTLGRTFLIQYISVMNKADWTALGTKILNVGKAIFTKSTYVNLGTKAWKGLNAAMKANWFGIVLSAITAVVTYLVLFRDRVSEATKMVGEFNKNLAKEQLELDALFGALKRANTETGERAALIQQINSKYGKYLGFMLSEKDSAEKIAAAYDLINAKIRERLALDMQETMRQNVVEKYSDKSAEAINSLHETLTGQRGIGETFANDAIALIQKTIRENIEKPVGEINQAIQQSLIDEFEGWYSHQQWVEISGDIQNFVTAQKNAQTEVSTLAKLSEEQLKASSEEIEKSTRNLLNQMTAQFDTYYNEMQNKETLPDRKEEVKQLALNTAKEYVQTAEKFIKDNPASGLIEFLKAPIEQYNNWIKSNTVVQNKSPWGEGLTLETASVDQLVKRYKQLFDWRKQISEDKDYTQFSDSGFTSRQEEMDALMTQLTELKKRLNDMGYNEFGKFLKTTKNATNKELEEQRKVIKELTTGLDTYFIERENSIKNAYLNEEITAGQMNARLEQNETARNLAHAELRKAFLNMDNDFFAQQYGMEKDQQDKLNKLDIQDDNLLAEQQKKLQDALNNEVEIRIKHQQKIEKILVENNPLLKVREDYQTQLESLGLFQRNTENLDKESAKKRMDIFTAFSKDSQTMTTEMLRESLENNSLFAGYTKNMKEEEYAALLIMLQNYLEASEEAEVRARERRKRIIEKTWQGTDEYQSFQNRETEDNSNVTQAKRNQSLGIGSEDDVMDAELIGIYNKMEALQAYYEFSKQAGLEDLEAKRQLDELQTELDDKFLESQQLKIERMREYTDSIVTFSESMGEAAFGEVDDRKKAGQQVIKSLLDTTKKLIVQWATQKAMNLFFKQGMNADDATTAATSQAIQLGKATGDITIQGAKTTADVALGAVSGAAKETGRLGLAGLAIGAIIAAALGALLSAAMGKAKSAMSSVGGKVGKSETKVKKLAPGMLTYAEGRYPVLGNDGQTYDAKYESKLKTGVYRGGAHYGIFSEKQPEMVIDGPTTQRMMLNHRELYDSIMFLSRNKTLPTYAEGRYPEDISVNNDTNQTDQTAAITESVLRTIMPVMEANANAISQLNIQLAEGIEINTYGPRGLDNALRKLDKFNRTNKRN